MRKQMSRIVSVLILTVLIIISVYKVSNLLQLKSSKERYADFFTEKNQIEVLFIGNSHVRTSILPMELWGDYGITSYNLAGDGNTIPTAYWTLVNALDYQIPKVVVMDVFDMWPGRKISVTWGQLHTSLDAFPLSMHKFQTVMDLVDDENVTDKDGQPLYEKRWGLLFNLAEYHTRWSTLGRGDFRSQASLESYSTVWKGASPYLDIVSRDEHIYVESDDLYYDEIARDYLVRMIQLCADKNVDLLLINTGYDCSDEAKYFADSVNEIARQNEIPYIDFTGLDIINFESDLASSGDNTHVNISGAEKITSFIGQRLTTQYQLSDYSNDEKYDSWRSAYQSYVTDKTYYLCAQGYLASYFMVLADDDYNIIIEILDNSIIYEENNAAMFKNLGIELDKSMDNNLLALDMAKKEVSYFSNSYEPDSKWMSVLGEMSLSCDLDEQGDICAYRMYLNGQEVYEADASKPARIRIAAINRDLGEVVDVHTF